MNFAGARDDAMHQPLGDWYSADERADSELQVLATTRGSATTEAMLLREVMEVLPIHSSLTSCSTNIAGVANQEPRDVALLELRLKGGSSLAVALCRIKVLTCATGLPVTR